MPSQYPDGPPLTPEADVAVRPAATLSPGERTRAELAVLAQLSNWPGALVVATHDRRLRDALRLERVVEL
jgi:ATPase subunit of ABC transporter with duplicated ATPase domains